MLLACLVVFVILWRLGPVRLALPAWATTADPGRPADGGFHRVWDTIGGVFLAAAFAWLETTQPFYFTQDDVLVTELPGILVGCRGVWDGHFPSYNPYALLGAPLASLGIYSLTYPPTYLAYAIARGLLGNEHLTMEVFAALHLAAGYGLTRRLTARLGLGPAVAVPATLTFVLAGSVLIAGRSWHVFLPVVVWLPAVTHFVLTVRHRPVGVGWALGLGGCLGASFHVGFPQLSVYLGAFTVVPLAVSGACGGVPWRRLAWLVPAVGVAAAVALPLAVCQFNLGKNLDRQPIPTLATPLSRLVATMVLPYPLATADHPYFHGNRDTDRMGALNFAGGPVAVAFFVGLAVLVACRTTRRDWDAAVWSLCGLTAFLMVLGDAGGLWPVVSELPVVGMVNRHPLRVLPFLAFYAALGGGQVLERVRRWSPTADRLAAPLAVAWLALLAWHVGQCTTAFYSYGFRPYPALDAGPAGAIPDPGAARAMGWARQRSPAADFVEVLPLQTSGVYGVPVLHGYDPVVEGQPAYRAAVARLKASPAEAGAAYGVRWHLVHRSVATPDLSEADGARAFEESFPLADLFAAWNPGALPVRKADAACTLHESPDAAPLAFVEAQPTRALPVRLRASGVGADVAGVRPGERVVLNFLRYPESELYSDGTRLPLTDDPWGRVSAVLPAPATNLTLRYQAPWAKGFVAAAVAFLVAAGCGLALRRVDRRAGTTGPISRGRE